MEIKIDAIIFNYENLFKASELGLKEFFDINYEKIRSEMARVATDVIHQSILAGTSNNPDFVLNIQKANVGGVYKLLSNLKKIDDEKVK